MKIWLSFLIIVLSLNSSVCYGADVILKGNSAPYDGILLTREQALDTRKELIDADTNKALVESYRKSLDLFNVREQNYNTQIDLMVDSNKKLSEQNSSLRNQADFNKYIYFGLGIIVTGISIYAAKKLTESSK